MLKAAIATRKLLPLESGKARSCGAAESQAESYDCATAGISWLIS
jgi:hypothetical protein